MPIRISLEQEPAVVFASRLFYTQQDTAEEAARELRQQEPAVNAASLRRVPGARWTLKLYAGNEKEERNSFTFFAAPPASRER